MLITVLLIVAFILALLAAINVPSRISLGWLAVALCILVWILTVLPSTALHL